MAKNKKDDPKKPASEEEALRERVDAMLDPLRPDAPPPAPAQPEAPAAPEPAKQAEVPPPLNIFEGVGTAPEVPSKLLKENGLSKRGAKSDKDAKVSDEKTASEPAPAAEVAPEAEHVVPVRTGEKVIQPLPPAEAADAETAGESDIPAEIPVPEKTALDDPETDKAVEDISVHEADALIAAEDQARETRPTGAKPKRPGVNSKFAGLFRTKKFWLVLVLLAVIALLAVPVTRYIAIGLFYKKTVTVSVLDSNTDTPVSSADVSLRGQTARTNGEGLATFKAPPGPGTLSISKKYYKTYGNNQFVGLRGTSSFKVKLVATGRQVPITVLNKVSGDPVNGAEVDVSDTTARTDSKGLAYVVLPATSQTANATVTASGFNLLKANIQVTSNKVAANVLPLLPSGQVYFLSNASGNIDVVKASLDGSGRQTVLAGTGHEDPRATSLLASRDWRYLVLKANRDSSGTALYLIDGRTNKVSKIDSAAADYQLVGWYDHRFVYDRIDAGMGRWQPGREALKSYDADQDKLINLDQNQAQGDSGNYVYENFYNFYLLDDQVVYNTLWYGYNANGNYDVSGKTAAIRGVTPEGANKKDYQTFDMNGVSGIQAALYEPQAIDYAVFSAADNKTTYYQYEDQKVSPAANLDQTSFNKTYPTYLLSPGGKQAFWSDLRDGKNALFLGDNNAGSPDQLAASSDYAPYGWYTDTYLLVSKNSSELYITTPGALKKNRTPLKLTDYYKPAETYPGYGYGYGGL